MNLIGTRQPRTEDARFLTGNGTFIENLHVPDAAHVVFTRSIMAHATITSIDTSAAEQADGVIAVFTAATLGLAPVAPEYASLGVAEEMDRWLLANDRVRFVGEPIVAVVATTRAAATDAAELVDIDYEPLTAVIGVDAASVNEVLLFPEAGTNVAYDLYTDPSDDFFDGCAVVVRQAITNQRVAPCPLEVRAGAATWTADGRLQQWASTQNPHGARTQLAMVYGVEDEEIRVITPDVGGGFGVKIGLGAEELMLGQLARLTERPVKFVETRSESMMAMGHGRAQQQVVEIGGTRDGRIEAYRLSITGDCGAYPRMAAILPGITAMMAPGVYDIERVEVIGTAVVTNTCPVVAFRGAGRPEATAAIERAVDLFANEIGLDPIDVRKTNFVAADSFPFDSATGATYDSGNYQSAFSTLLDVIDDLEFRREQAARRQAGTAVQVGLGFATYVEVTAPLIDPEWADVEVKPDETVVARVGTLPQGQGHETTFAMLLSDHLGIDIDQITLEFGDTDNERMGGGTFGSRSMQIGGAALHSAAGDLIELARAAAAHRLECDVADVVFDKGARKFHVVGTPAVSLSWGDLASTMEADERLGCDATFDPEGSTFPFGAHAAIVEVDTETGKVELLRFVAVDDAGTLLNPMLAEGQIHGGVAQGVAQALLEEFTYDPDGNPITANLADYSFISACELPAIETIAMETPSPLNELGAKGIGESGSIGSTPAVQNAVIDALAHLGITHIDIPLTPERVWRALHPNRLTS